MDAAITSQGLYDFCDFFLERDLDQVRFMQSVLKPEDLTNRIKVWSEEEVAAGRLMPGSWPLLDAVLISGELARGRAAEMTGYAERQGRAVLSKLIDRGILASNTPKGAVRLSLLFDVLER